MRQAAEDARHQSGALSLGLIIAGPTGSGKSELAAALARRLNGELVSADSRQVYRGLDAATAKERPEGVRTHLLDAADPQEAFDVGRFLREARKAVDDIRERGRRPIVVGGTGLYIKAFLEGLSELPPRDEKIRARLQSESESALRLRLAKDDPAVEKSIPKGNRQRLIRALEVLELTGEPISASWNKKTGAAPGRWLALRVDWPAEQLRARLERRCEAMWPGLLAEVKILRNDYTGKEPGFESLGYREAFAVIEGKLSQKDAYELFLGATLRYAKRQRTWFRNQLKADAIEGGPVEKMLEQALNLAARA